MPQYSIKLCTYDPAIIDAFEQLRKARKLAAFTHEALKQFLSTEKGGQVLLLMEGKVTEHSLAPTPLSADVPSVDMPFEPKGLSSNSSTVLHIDSSSVLDSILK